MRVLATLFVLFLVGACDSPTRTEKPDYRYGTYSTWTRYRLLDGEPIVLWTRGDGARFELTNGTLRCFEKEEYPDEIVITWQLTTPDGPFLFEGSGRWDMGEVRCDLVGETGLRFTIASTGETVASADEIRIGRCLNFNLRLPSADVWLLGSPWDDTDDPIPNDVVFPNTMPEMFFSGPAFCD